MLTQCNFLLKIVLGFYMTIFTCTVLYRAACTWKTVLRKGDNKPNYATAPFTADDGTIAVTQWQHTV